MTQDSCKVVAIEHLSLDGVYQAPARADEDTRDGFKKGGWAMAREDVKMQQVIGRYMSSGWSLLVGRTTYEDLYQAWPTRQPAHFMTHALTGVQKFVVCHNADYPLPWANSTLLAGEATQTVAKLKAEYDQTLIIFGSGVLVRSLMEHKLVDEFLLMIHPLVLSEGYRFFDGKAPFAEFNLVEVVKGDTGIMAAMYQQA